MNGKLRAFPAKRVPLAVGLIGAFIAGWVVQQKLVGQRSAFVVREPGQTAWAVYFSPKGGCTDAIVRELDQAKTTVLVQAYSFTSKPIAEALVKAHKRGVQVKVILDESHLTDKYSEADFLSRMGIPTAIDGVHAIAHNKVMILDGETVITGSFNFTKQAETSNAENVLVVKDKALAERYADNWTMHHGHAVPYRGKKTS